LVLYANIEAAIAILLYKRGFGKGKEVVTFLANIIKSVLAVKFWSYKADDRSDWSVCKRNGREIP